jgi:tetratricopeptide (TPR) repeat protein
LSRIGRTNIAMTRGNLAVAQASYEAILADATLAGERDAQARAEHGLGVTHEMRGGRDKAVMHFWNAFQLFGDEPSQLRVLSDLGLTLRALGEYEAAEQALRRVIEHANLDSGINPLIELMYLASARGDRIGFERWRERALVLEPRMTPGSRVDFHLKSGVGLARFGNWTRARDSLAASHALAAEHGLHEFEFRVERIQAGLPACELALASCSADDREPTTQFEPVREVAASLVQLVG